ncbi:type II toxin-antitoxin system ParD family antitoxin [Xaviernesmea oryzae]|nr:type II toxin-antitoxin system ParD family antitoxin [Xaviernesmea oryzae]
MSVHLEQRLERFVEKQVESGRYASADDVVRDALQMMEENESKRDLLRVHLAEGAAQADRDEFVDDFSFDAFKNEVDQDES